MDATQNAEVDILTDEASQSATFNFRIPRGAVGQQGLTGKTGATGETGAAGKDGTTYTPEIGTVNTVEANNDAKASIELDGDRAKFNFDIPKGVGVKSIEFTSTTDESGEAGKPGAIDTYTITYTNNQKTTYDVFNGRDGDARIADDEEPSETTVWSSQKIASVLKTAEDVPLTSLVDLITNDATAPTSGTEDVPFVNAYYVKNGVCNVCLDFTPKGTQLIGNYRLGNHPMPLPVVSQYINILPFGSNLATYTNLRTGAVLLDPIGNFILYDIFPGQRYLVSFSYPVA